MIVIKNEQNKNQISLKLFNSYDYSTNKFQVINQIQVVRPKNFKKFKRYDIVLLINGLPLVLIELKNMDVKISEAFEQIKNSYVPNFKTLFNYVQFFVVSNQKEL
ncbi:type I restriction endonuclease ['Camptotheca acuminata' phytoplasma]|uniref:type I restriction endonuclease n=1 Tax='Camptotheca acuminata' phytoplasma TaxID=3239192 RepID=UPI00351A05A6